MTLNSIAKYSISFILGVTATIVYMTFIHGTKPGNAEREALFSVIDEFGYVGVEQLIFNRYGSNVVLIDHSGASKNIPSSVFFSKRQVQSNHPIRDPKLNNIQIPKVSVEPISTPPQAPRKNITSHQLPPQKAKSQNQTLAKAKTLSKAQIHQLLDDPQSDQQLLNAIVPKMFEAVPKEISLVYSPPSGEVKDSLIVFSDPSCPYCREFHFKYLPRLIEDGYEVRYFPIARITGINSDDSYKFSKSVAKNLQWAMCLEDRHAQIEKVFKAKGQYTPPTPKTCDSKRFDIERNIKMSAHLVQASKGTPAIYSSKGYKSNGVSADGKTLLMEGIAKYTEENYQHFVQQLTSFDKVNNHATAGR